MLQEVGEEGLLLMWPPRARARAPLEARSRWGVSSPNLGETNPPLDAPGGVDPSASGLISESLSFDRCVRDAAGRLLGARVGHRKEHERSALRAKLDH